VRSGANCQQRNQTRPSDPQRLSLAEAIEGEIDLVDVLHHLTELLRLHERGRRRNPLSPRRAFFRPSPRPLGLPLRAQIVDLRIEEGPMLRRGVLRRESEGAERVAGLLREGLRNVVVERGGSRARSREGSVAASVGAHDHLWLRSAAGGGCW